MKTPASIWPAVAGSVWLLALCSCTGTSPIRIPFTLTSADNLSVRATLNGTDAVDLMFHTAIDSVSLTKAAVAKAASFRADGTATVRSWGGSATARHSIGNTLQIGPLVFRDLAITESDNSGPGTDGKFGPNLFAGRVLEIDFDAGEIVLHDTLPALGSQWQRLDLLVRDGSLFVVGEVAVGERRYPTEFLLHSGFGGAALLDEQFVQMHGLDAQLVTIRENELRDSYGNVVKTRTVRLPSLLLGTLVFRDVPVGIFDGALGARRMSILGGGLLKRCNLMLDIGNGQLYVAPSGRMATPFGS